MKRLISLALAIAACAALPAPALARPTPVKVKIGDNFFKADHVTVRRGTTVRWRWVGRLMHNVTVTEGPQRFHSATQSTGTFRQKLRRRGRYTLVCTIHPGMDMTLRVR
jgi:plastocyanin